jgi:hypothetical protein
VSCWKLNWLVPKERYLYPSIAYTYPTSLIGWVVIKAALEPTVRLRSDQIVDSWTVTFKVSFQEVRFPGILEFRDRCRRFRRRSTISRLLCCCTMHTAQDRADDTALFCRSGTHSTRRFRLLSLVRMLCTRVGNHVTLSFVNTTASRRLFFLDVKPARLCKCSHTCYLTKQR